MILRSVDHLLGDDEDILLQLGIRSLIVAEHELAVLNVQLRLCLSLRRLSE